MTKPKSQRLRHVSPFLQRLVTAFPGGVAYVDRNLVFTHCNDVQAAYFGREAEAVIGKPLHEVAPDNPQFWQEIERVALTGERFAQSALSVTWRDRLEEGEHLYLVSYIADFDRNAHVRGVFMTALDVTESVLRERGIESSVAKLQDRIDALETTLKERDLLVGIISHELRTPLTTIFGNAHMLVRRLEDMDVESRNRAILDIREEAERLNTLVENMLLLARSGAQAPVPTESVPLDHVLSQVAVEYHRRFNERSFVVSVKPQDLVAEGQPDYIKQVVHNLLSNAEKYSPGGEQIDVRARRNGAEVVVSIFDRGSGIALAEAEIIFQAFYRSDRTSTKVGGAGIGLAVCKLLVQSQSGRIWATPRRGGGSVFSFSLPAAA